MKNNYPVRYGLMPIKGFTELLGSFVICNERTVAYAVSKCYVLEEFIKYNEDGTTDKLYSVAFPYGEVYLSNKVNDQENNFEKDQVLSCKTEEVFSSFEEAKAKCRQKNIMLFEQEIKKKKKPDEYIDLIEAKVQLIEQKANDLTKNISSSNRKRLAYERI